MTPLVWAIVLFVSALALLALELFIPSGGILGVLAVASVIGSLIFVIIGKGYVAGTVYLFFLSIFVPILVVAALNYWPHTSVGRKILNVSPDGEGEPPIEPRHLHLVGKQGVAQTKMLPSGAVRIEGKNYDAVAEGAGLDQGVAIEVIRVDGTRIVVREMRGVAPDQIAGDQSPVSEVIPDPFEDPPI